MNDAMQRFLLGGMFIMLMLWIFVLFLLLELPDPVTGGVAATLAIVCIFGEIYIIDDFSEE